LRRVARDPDSPRDVPAEGVARGQGPEERLKGLVLDEGSASRGASADVLAAHAPVKPSVPNAGSRALDEQRSERA
jgi:hypothetical protein